MRATVIRKPLISIACGQFALSLMQVMFMFYYVKVYLMVFRVPHLWFNIAQTSFMFWNAINDPLLGYMQDRQGSWMNSRPHVIRFFAPFIAVSFVFMWFPWSKGSSYEGLHLLLSLFLYDTFHSAIEVAWGALFADLTKEPRFRVLAIKYSQISVLISVNVIVISEKLTNSLENFGVFQWLCIVVSIIAFLCLVTSGSLKRALPFIEENGLCEHSNKADVKNSFVGNNVGASLVTVREIFCDRDFVVIIATNFIHSARSIIHMNFASMAIDILIPQDILPKGSFRLSLFYGILTIGPQILFILSDGIIIRNGPYRILTRSYAISVFFALFFFSFSNPYCTMCFMLLDSITVHSTAPLFNIIISDFIDDDAKRHFRKAALSSLVFSIRSLFVKPTHSIAPVVVVYILNDYGYNHYISTNQPTNELVIAMRLLLLATPVVFGFLQYFIFQYCSLHTRRVSKTEDV